jgi:uncharacterized protein (TIGR01777 family)
MIFCFLFDSIIINFKTSKVKLFNVIPNIVPLEENQSDTSIDRNSSVLISGGSGCVGKYLTSFLLFKGYKVSHLSRNAYQSGKITVFKWDPEKNIIDPAAFDNTDFLIHLAGSNIGEKRWTKARKEEIVKSRVDSARLLHKVIGDNKIPLKAFISASATGYYGAVTSDQIFVEDDPPGNDFLSNTCRLWEESADLFGNIGIRTVKIRTAVVLEKNDSALSKLMMPGKLGFLVQTGTGRQYMPWIHINDLCNVYFKALTDTGMNGAYNAVSPYHVTLGDFMKVLGHVMKKPVLFPPVPSFILKAALGEMSDMILKGSRISSVKLENTGFRFLFANLEDALKNIIPD